MPCTSRYNSLLNLRYRACTILSWRAMYLSTAGANGTWRRGRETYKHKVVTLAISMNYDITCFYCKELGFYLFSYAFLCFPTLSLLHVPNMSQIGSSKITIFATFWMSLRGGACAKKPISYIKNL